MDGASDRTTDRTMGYPQDSTNDGTSERTMDMDPNYEQTDKQTTEGGGNKNVSSMNVLLIPASQTEQKLEVLNKLFLLPVNNFIQKIH